MTGFLSYFSTAPSTDGYDYCFSVNGRQLIISCDLLIGRVEHSYSAQQVLSGQIIPTAFIVPNLYSWYIRLGEDFFSVNFKTLGFVTGVLEFMKGMHANVNNYCNGRPYAYCPGDVKNFDDSIQLAALVSSKRVQELVPVTSNNYNNSDP